MINAMKSGTNMDEIVQVFIMVAILISAVGGPVLQAFLKRKKEQKERDQRDLRRSSEPQPEVDKAEAVEEEEPSVESQTAPPSMEDVLDKMFGRGWRSQQPEEPKAPPPRRVFVQKAVEGELVPAVKEEPKIVTASPDRVAPAVPLVDVAAHRMSADLSDMKRAVVLSEILSPPLAMRSDAYGN